MTNEMVESHSDLTHTLGSKRQVIIFPEEGPHGQRMIIASEKDLLSMTPEEIRLDMENCLAIGFLSKDGRTLKLDPYYYCGEGKLYPSQIELFEDLRVLFEANGLNLELLLG